MLLSKLVEVFQFCHKHNVFMPTWVDFIVAPAMANCIVTTLGSRWTCSLILLWLWLLRHSQQSAIPTYHRVDLLAVPSRQIQYCRIHRIHLDIFPVFLLLHPLLVRCDESHCRSSKNRAWSNSRESQPDLTFPRHSCPLPCCKSWRWLDENTVQPELVSRLLMGFMLLISFIFTQATKPGGVVSQGVRV